MPIEGPAESVTERLTERPTERLTTVGDEPSTVTLTINTTDQPTRVPIELRVHGVTGTPAEQMLDRQIIGHVAGDGEAGFFRPRAEYGAANSHGPGGARLEAYRWGNLTAGAAARAFWLLMLPFTLANVAIWMRPPAVGVSRWLLRGLSRVFALTMTATFTLMAVGLALDLVAWQCAATPDNRCIDARPWMQFVFTDFFEPTGRRLALMALVPIGVVCLLWYLARRTWARYESFSVPDVSPQGDGIATPTFWDGRAQVGRLRGLHVAAGFAVVDAVLIYVLMRHDMSVDSYAGVDLGVAPSAVVAAGRAIAIGVVAVLALCVLLLFSSRMIDRGSKSVGARKIANGLRAISILLTLLTLGYALVPRADWGTSGALPGYAGTVVALFAGQTAILALLMLIILPMRRRCKGAMFGGFGMPIIASLALGLGAAFAAGVAYRVADFLDRGAVPSPANFDSPSTAPRLEPPISYQWAGFGVLVVLAVVVMVLLWNRLITRPGLRRKARPDTDADYPDGRRRDPGRANTIDRAIATARMTDHVSRTFATAWVVLAAAGAVSTGLAFAKIGPVQLADSNTVGADILSGLTNLGTYLISLFAFALVLLGIQTYRNERVRRTVGVIWDLATFWPRAAHPLAPPCYAERVVPELVHRSTWLANEQGGVVLSGHSQGSVLVAAAVLQLPDAALERTSLLTYGSPLCRLYMKAFPNYWGQQVVDKVGAAVADRNGSPRWINLWRRTDPIGGAIGVGDRRLVDPQGFNSPPGDRVPPPVAGHSGYQVTVDFADAVKDLLARMPPAPPAAAPPPIPQERRPA
jgi:hypothetical protein